MIDHDVHWLTTSRKEVHGGMQERLGMQATHRWEDDEAGMDGLRFDKSAEISRVLGHKNEVALDATTQDSVVGCSEPAEVAWVLRDVQALRIQAGCDVRRQTFVEE